jgi:hypothetical protein
MVGGGKGKPTELTIESASIGRGSVSQQHQTIVAWLLEPWYWDQFTNGSEALTLSSSYGLRLTQGFLFLLKDRRDSQAGDTVRVGLVLALNWGMGVARSSLGIF